MNDRPLTSKDQLARQAYERWLEEPGEAGDSEPETIFTDGFNAGRCSAETPAHTSGEPILRRLLWLCYTSGVGYRDDGELQDNRAQPFIDFRRDHPREIEEKMHERGYRQMVAAEKTGSATDDPHSDQPVELNP